jgi:hypothetical protein
MNKDDLAGGVSFVVNNCANIIHRVFQMLHFIATCMACHRYRWNLRGDNEVDETLMGVSLGSRFLGRAVADPVYQPFSGRGWRKLENLAGQT